MSRWPIRWRLTAWYAVTMTAIVAAVGGVIYLGLRSELNEELDEQLLARTATLAMSTRPADGRPTLDERVIAGGDDDELIRLWTAEGDLLLDSWRNGDGLLTSDDVRALVSPVDERTLLPITSLDVDGESYRVTVALLGDRDAAYGVLEVAHSRQDVEETLGSLRLLFLVAAPAALAAALAGGYLIAGRALAPVGAITTLARRVSGADLSDRLDLDLPDDELGRLAKTFDDMLDRVEDAFERQRRFTGDAAHELRTPLSLIRTRIDLALTRDRSQSEYRETLVELDSDVVRLSNLIGTLLTLARSDAGTLTLDRQPTAIHETIRGVVEQYRDAVAEVNVHVDPESELVMATVDEDLVIQLLVNLIDNAVAHTPPGGSVAVGCATRDRVCVIWVADTGTGIASEHIDRVFDRFYRVDAGRTAGAGGVGLGLSISKTIVEAHGGTIRLQSEAGRGTRVDVSIPF